MKLFKCQHCGQLLYFENRQCQSCSRRLGYLPEADTLSALEAGGDTWLPLVSPEVPYRFCANAEYDTCNWLVLADAEGRFCAACRHNRTIPNLNIQENLARWRKFELAKHRLVYTLIRLELPLDNIVFDFLADIPGAPRVLTGHENGLITINLTEADDAERETIRQRMSEPYRTLLGHFRHESGHYYWERLVRDPGGIESFRELFGDERQDYGQALQANYWGGAKTNWQQMHISSYAASHPWEDFAETWAHYLHIVDTLEMAFAFGICIRPELDKTADLCVNVDFDPHEMKDVNRLIEAWLPLTFAMNSINRSMGEPDLYPFLLSPAVMTKIGFVHDLVHMKP